MESKTSLYILDNRKLMCEGYLSMLKGNKKIALNLVASSGKELISASKKQNPDVFLLFSSCVINGEGGLQLLSEIKTYCPQSQILIYGKSTSLNLITTFFINGATGYISENSCLSELKEAISVIAKNSFFIEKKLIHGFGMTLLKKLKEKKSLKSTALTDKEIIIIRMVCEEKQNNEIASALNTTIDAIKHQRKIIYRKTCAKSSLSLTRFAWNNDIF